MEKLQCSRNKALKLTNILKYKMDFTDEDCKLDTQVQQMQSYIKVKGANQIGPLVQYTKSFVNDTGELDIEMFFLLQCNNFIQKVEHPYQMESILRIKNCMYVRYTGPEEKLKFAYDKINLVAFEEDIPLRGDSYTIFVNRQDDMIVADVFMPKTERIE